MLISLNNTSPIAISRKSIFVKRGTYSESANVSVLSNQFIHFDDVIIDFSEGYALHLGSAVDDATLKGRLNIQGKGMTTSPDGCLIYQESGSSNIDAGNCWITLEPDYSDAHTSEEMCMCYIRGDHCWWKLFANSVSINTNQKFVGINVLANFNRIDAHLQTMTTSNSSANYGIEIESDFNICKVAVKNITDTTGNTGVGVILPAGGDYNCVYGNSTGCDSANLSNSGTGNKTGELAV